MGFWSKLFGKKEESKPADDTMANPVASTDDTADTTEESAEVSEENAE